MLGKLNPTPEDELLDSPSVQVAADPSGCGLLQFFMIRQQ
jgi:hypothetical protein